MDRFGAHFYGSNAIFIGNPSLFFNLWVSIPWKIAFSNRSRKKIEKNRFPEPRFVTPHPRNSAAGNRFLSIFFTDHKEITIFLKMGTQKLKKWDWNWKIGPNWAQKIDFSTIFWLFPRKPSLFLIKMLEKGRFSRKTGRLSNFIDGFLVKDWKIGRIGHFLSFFRKKCHFFDFFWKKCHFFDFFWKNW